MFIWAPKIGGPVQVPIWHMAIDGPVYICTEKAMHAEKNKNKSIRLCGISSWQTELPMSEHLHGLWVMACVRRVSVFQQFR